MAKVFLWMGAVLLAIYLVKSQFLNSKTWTPFRDGCVVAGSGSEEQCNCLANYVHERFSDQEVKRIMETEITDPVFADKVDRAVMAGTLACSNPR